MAEPIETLDDLRCHEHPGIRLNDNIAAIIITQSEKYNSGRGLYRYYCKACAEQGNGRHHRGYDCPKCGTVVGDYIIEMKDPRDVPVDPAKTVMFSREDRYFIYKCSICNSQLGEHLANPKKVRENIKA